MKKLLTLFAIILSVGMANAQTKEETITWLKDKLSKYIMGRDYDPERFTDIALMSIDENKIVFVYKFKNYAGELDHMKEILPISISRIDTNGYFIYSEKVCQINRNGTTKFEEKSMLTIAPVEDDIRSRIEKALKHLESVRPKKQETF